MGKDAPTVDAPDMGCDRTPCGQIYVELDEPADWFGGCENGDTKILPDLKDFNGICALINGNGDTFAEWYYGASMQHKSGRYVYSDGELISLLVLFALSVSTLSFSVVKFSINITYPVSTTPIALSLMVGQAPFGEARTCYFGGTFYDQFPKIACKRKSNRSRHTTETSTTIQASTHTSFTPFLAHTHIHIRIHTVDSSRYKNLKMKRGD